MSSKQAQVKTVKKEHPTMVMFATFSLGYFFIYQSGCILVFLMGVMLPIVFVIVHASLRLRNLKNKVIFRKIHLLHSTITKWISNIEELNVFKTCLYLIFYRLQALQKWLGLLRKPPWHWYWMSGALSQIWNISRSSLILKLVLSGLYGNLDVLIDISMFCLFFLGSILPQYMA